MSDASTIGPYTICGQLAAGGMATIWLGHSLESRRPVAIKRLPKQFASDLEFVTMFMDETWLATRVRHVNVVKTIEVLNENSELCLVMEYVEGETLSRAMKAARVKREPIPMDVASAILSGALAGLHAVHEARSDDGKPLNAVHRDVSPQNIMVGVDGYPRLLDFGVAKAAGRLHTTRTGQLKGKIAYMSPEQLDYDDVDRLSDIYAAGVVLWEVLAGRRLYEADNEGPLVRMVLEGPKTLPSAHRAEIPPALDEVVGRALTRAPKERFQTAAEMASALERAMPPARPSKVSEWITSLAAPSLDKRAALVASLLAGQPGNIPAPPSSQSVGSALRSAKPASSPSSSSLRSGPARPQPASEPSIPSLRSSGGLRSHPSEPSMPSVSSGGSLRSSPAASGVSEGSTAKARQRHVLVIDDSEVILTNIRRVLEGDGHQVTTTTQTVGAARFLVNCDLAIIDYHMPGIDGGTVIKSLRAASQTSGRSCPFYLYTADAEVARDYAKLGFDGVFVNKGDDEALLRQVRSAIRILQLRAMKR